ncbi:hypothetical protein ElyMa_002229400 [Elysia marginata]|uniref:Uncharacterized protein n=1 Tax=Elysia marginata TaxID=1093978 RepID=A0AAV4FVH1_9GAST|nr:hypothetical protein ElyMa_002229400 [Elysia marginata]
MQSVGQCKAEGTVSSENEDFVLRFHTTVEDDESMAVESAAVMDGDEPQPAPLTAISTAGDPRCRPPS